MAMGSMGGRALGTGFVSLAHEIEAARMLNLPVRSGLGNVEAETCGSGSPRAGRHEPPRLRFRVRSSPEIPPGGLRVEKAKGYDATLIEA